MALLSFTFYQLEATMNHKVLSVHYLRGLAALMVVALHYSFYLPENISVFFGSGSVGVDIFFLISGFIITFATRKRADTLYNFSIKRFFRIYPLFIIIWVTSMLTVNADASILSKLQSLFLFMVDYNGSNAPAFGFNLMGPPWTLTYEILFYAIFGISMCISHKYRALISGLSIVIIVFGLQFIFNGNVSLAAQTSADMIVRHWWQVPVKILSTPILFEFVVGMLLAEIYIRTADYRNTIVSSVILLLGVVVFTALYFSGEMRLLGFKGGIWVALTIFIPFIVFDKLHGFKESRVMLYLGDISYSIYISHFLLLTALMHYHPDILASHNGYVVFMFLFASCLALSSLLHRYIELPSIALGKKLILDRRVIIPASIKKRAI